LSDNGKYNNRFFTILKRLAWTVFFIVLGLESVNFVFREKERLYTNYLPFELKDSLATDFTQAGPDTLLAGKIILQMDSIPLFWQSSDINTDEEDPDNGAVVMYNNDRELEIYIDSDGKHRDRGGNWMAMLFDETIDDYLQDRNRVQLTVKDPETREISAVTIDLQRKRNNTELYMAGGLILILIFTFFNSYLLIRYSDNHENILIVYFLIFLVSPSLKYLPVPVISDIWSDLISPFWGILFYHFINVKLNTNQPIRKLYIQSALIYVSVSILSVLLHIGEFLEIVLYIWPIFWALKAILMLRKEYHNSQKIEYRRLLSAFKGLSISGIGIAIVLGGSLLLVTVLPGIHLLIKSAVLSKILGASLGISVVIGVLVIFVGVLWFFGSFTWSLLTGTALDVKIRSTLIYTIVGILFVTVFGLIDYSLGELLQYLFGKFVGSEFIAGIPGTIVLISLFVPIRNRVERIVDNKLNTSELDFLERADTFTKNLTEEGVVEGFEEYICDNLVKKLPIDKVALISYDSKIDGYRFNEIRGSDVEENSVVEDSRRALNGTLVHNVHESVSDNPRDISSFPLIIPIIYEDEHKWFLALGKKKDRTIYNKNDLNAFEKLVDKIKLSLKFILVYEDIVNGKYEQIIREKDATIRDLQEKIRLQNNKTNP